MPKGHPLTQPKELTCSWCERVFSSHQTAKYCGARCRDKSRYQRDRDKRLVAVSKYRTDNKAAIRERAKARRVADPIKYKQQAHESYIRNRDKRIAAALEYQKARIDVNRTRLANRRSRRTSQYIVTKRDYTRLLHTYRGECAYCKTKLTAAGRSLPTSLQWDHVLPLDKGGEHRIGNLVPACRSCNTSKNANILMTWFRYVTKNYDYDSSKYLRKYR